MKIAHIIFSMQMGGTETMLVDIMNEQVKSNEVHLVVINRNYATYLMNTISSKVKIHLINRSPNSKDIFSVIKMNFILWKTNPDVIHAHNANMSKIIFPCISQNRLDVTYHSMGNELIMMDRYRNLYGISDAVSNDIHSRSGLPVKTIYNGIRCDLISKSVMKPMEEFRIVQIGRLESAIKGQDIAISAVSDLRKLGLNVTLDLIGEGKDKTALERLTQYYGITDSVRFLGVKDRTYVYSHFKNYHLLVQPSRTEGFGLTIAEGLAANIPVVISDLAGPMEIIKQGEFGYFFESGNQDDCFSKIHHVITNYEKAFEMSTEGRNFVESTFSVYKTAGNYLSCYCTKMEK